MVSYSALNDLRMHANKELVTGFLKDKLKFRGFVISDWQGIDRITTPPHLNYLYSVYAGISAGIDMIQVPYNYTEFINEINSQIKKNLIPMSRIDDAGKRILRVKFTMGLFEEPLADVSFANHLGTQGTSSGSREKISSAENCKNGDKPLLPLPKKTRKILVAGTHANPKWQINK